MVHKDEITRIRVGSKLHRGGYVGMHTSDCICVFPNGVAREKRIAVRSPTREIQAAGTRLLHYSEAAAFELAAELVTSSSQRTRNERINLLNASRPILAFWYYRFSFFLAFLLRYSLLYNLVFSDSQKGN